MAQQDADARIAAQQAESAKLDAIESTFKKLEEMKRWSDKDAEAFSEASTALRSIMEKYTGTSSPPRVTSAVSRVSRLWESPAFKQRAADVARDKAAAEAYRNSPHGRCDLLCYEGFDFCRRPCSWGDDDCLNRCRAKLSTCRAGCPTK